MTQRTILAVASAGGHWVQLQRLSPAWEGHRLVYATTAQGVTSSEGHPVHQVTDANRWERLKMMRMAFEVFWLVLRLRPDAVVTTGAAPGLAAVAFGRLVGARTLWIDSMANSEELSGSGRLARRIAHRCITQWPHLASANGVEHWGAVL